MIRKPSSEQVCEFFSSVARCVPIERMDASLVQRWIDNPKGLKIALAHALTGQILMGHTSELKVEFVAIDGSPTEVAAQIKKMGYRPATFAEAKTYCDKNPDAYGPRDGKLLNGVKKDRYIAIISNRDDTVECEYYYQYFGNSEVSDWSLCRRQNGYRESFAIVRL